MAALQKITPFLWFDTQGREAAKFYTSLFENSKIHNPEVLENTPSGTVEIITITLMGHDFTLMSAGPGFNINPSISFLVYCSDESEIDSLWKSLSEGGKALMPLNKYPFAEKYGWIQDKFGVSWQLMISQASEKQKVSPLLMFVGKNAGKTLEAITFYTSVFPNSEMRTAMHYGDGEGDKVEYIKHAEFTLSGNGFMAMDSGFMHDFNFNEAISFVIDCENQEDVDYFWSKLTADGGEESQCGWLKDKYGVSWQVVPRKLTELMSDPDKEKAGRVMQAMLQMKKIDIAKLQAAFDGK